MMKDWTKTMVKCIAKLIALMICIHIVVCILFFDGVMFHNPFGWECNKIYNHDVMLPVNWDVKKDNKCVYFEDENGKIMMFGIQMDSNTDKCRTPSFITDMRNFEIHDWQIFSSKNVIGTFHCKLNGEMKKMYFVYLPELESNGIFVLYNETYERILMQFVHMQNKNILK